MGLRSHSLGHPYVEMAAMLKGPGENFTKVLPARPQHIANTSLEDRQSNILLLQFDHVV